MSERITDKENIIPIMKNKDDARTEAYRITNYINFNIDKKAEKQILKGLFNEVIQFLIYKQKQPKPQKSEKQQELSIDELDFISIIIQILYLNCNTLQTHEMKLNIYNEQIRNRTPNKQNKIAEKKYCSDTWILLKTYNYFTENRLKMEEKSKLDYYELLLDIMKYSLSPKLYDTYLDDYTQFVQQKIEMENDPEQYQLKLERNHKYNLNQLKKVLLRKYDEQKRRENIHNAKKKKNHHGLRQTMSEPPNMEAVDGGRSRKRKRKRINKRISKTKKNHGK